MSAECTARTEVGGQDSTIRLQRTVPTSGIRFGGISKADVQAHFEPFLCLSVFGCLMFGMRTKDKVLDDQIQQKYCRIGSSVFFEGEWAPQGGHNMTDGLVWACKPTWDNCGGRACISAGDRGRDRLRYCFPFAALDLLITTYVD